MTTARRPLPDKLSDLILVAVKDLEKVEKSKKYVVDMWSWHYPTVKYVGKAEKPVEVCEVCLAGSVIAETFKASPDAECFPERYPPHVEKKLLALDYVRGGHIGTALNKVNESASHYRQYDGEWTVRVPQYKSSPARFKKRLREIAGALKALDL